MTNKIALCFLITRDIRNQKVWEQWWAGHEHQISLYVHYSDSVADRITSPMLQENRVRPVPTRWGDVSLVKAEGQLYKQAIKDPRNKFCILLSDTCIPVRKFTYTYNRLMRDTSKGIAPYRLIQSYSRDDDDFTPFVDTKACVNKLGLASMLGHSIYAMDQWKILSRKNIRDFLEMLRNKTFLQLFTKCIEVVPDSLAPDELMFVNYLAHKYPRRGVKSQLRNRTVTFVDFKGHAIHPLTYKTVGDDLADDMCSTGAMFARKFMRHNATLLKQLPIQC